jgi:hypothetical protein
MSWRHVKATGRRDTVEPEIVRVFRAAKFSVDLLGEPADLLVGAFGITHLCECKTGKAGLTPAQVYFRKRWKGEPPVTVRTAAHARKWVRIWTERAERTRIEFPKTRPVTWDEAVEVEQGRRP